MYACDAGQEEVIELLLGRGADPNTHKGNYLLLYLILVIRRKRYYNDDTAIGRY